MLRLEYYENYTLHDIEKESNRYLRIKLLEKRKQAIREMGTNWLRRQLLLKFQEDSIIEMDQKLESAMAPYTSYVLFPQEEVILYPQYHERVATKDFRCDITGARISKGSYYICYQAFLESLTTNRKYVLRRPWISELGNGDFFPLNISEMDQLELSLRYSYDGINQESPYDYYDISSRIGDSIRLRELHDSPKQKIIKF